MANDILNKKTQKKKPKFVRRSVDRYSKLGLRRKKKQVWRSPKGRDNKMRAKRRGYPATVSIGYGKDREMRGTIEDKKPILIYNLKDLEKVKKENIALIGKVGKKKKEEIVKKAKEKKVEIANVNSNKFLKQIERHKKLKEKKIEEAKTKKEIKKEKKEKKQKPESKEKPKEEKK